MPSTTGIVVTQGYMYSIFSFLPSSFTFFLVCLLKAPPSNLLSCFLQPLIRNLYNQFFHLASNDNSDRFCTGGSLPTSPGSIPHRRIILQEPDKGARNKGHVIIHNNYITGFEKKIERFCDIGL